MMTRVISAPTVSAVTRRVLGTRPRRVLAAVTLGLALLVVIVLTATLPAEERTFAAISAPVQSVLSIFVPFFGVLVMADARRNGSAGLRPCWLAAGLIGAGFAVFGLVATAIAVAIVSTGTGPWRAAGLIVAGSLIMQLLAASVGTAFGLLLRPPIVAELATIAVPLGCWLLLGTTPTLLPVREWTTPFAAVQQLFTGRLTPLDWFQWAVIAGLWGVGLNALGWLYTRHEEGNR